MKREPIPQTEVLAWLREHHPELHESAEIERAWVWLTATNLRDQAAVRESIKTYGFKFCKHGHVLPCGKTAMWGHSCDKPIGFKRKGSNKTKPTIDGRGQIVPQPERETQLSPEEMAMME